MLKERILSQWNFARIVRLVLGGVIIAQGVMVHDWGLGIMGSLFASMALFGFGCAGGACATPIKKSNNKSIQDVEFEEVR